jgi:tRNA threonylcarbamoyladenosine biosynthesis protein TsaB
MDSGVVLGIDTATAGMSVAVAPPGGRPLREEYVGPDAEGRPRHSEALLAAIDRCVGEAGGWISVQRLAVGLGPGSYTGLRIGISTARALAQARELPIAGVSTLAALAHGIAETPAGRDRPALPVLDARRGEAFAALHDPAGEELRAPFVASPGDLAEWVAGLEPAPLAAGDGSVRFRAQLEAAGASVAPDGDAVHRVFARHVCAIGAGAAASGPDRIRPIYLREPDAKRWIERDAGEPA